MGKRSEADRELVTLEQTAGSAMAYQVAQIYVMRHEKDQAFVWLEQAYRQHDGGLPYLRIETDYSPSDSARIAVRVEALFETVRGRRSVPAHGGS